MQRELLTSMLALGLIMGLATTAVAQGQQPTTGPGADHPNDQAGQANATARQAAARERHQELQSARQTILDGFKANRSVILEEYRASLNATRADFLVKKDAVLTKCAEARGDFTNNTGATESPEHAKCVSDGLRPLAEQARADNRAARELAQGKLVQERAMGMSAWAKGLREANAHYQARTGEPPARA